MGHEWLSLHHRSIICGQGARKRENVKVVLAHSRKRVSLDIDHPAYLLRSAHTYGSTRALRLERWSASSHRVSKVSFDSQSKCLPKDLAHPKLEPRRYCPLPSTRDLQYTSEIFPTFQSRSSSSLLPVPSPTLPSSHPVAQPSFQPSTPPTYIPRQSSHLPQHTPLRPPPLHRSYTAPPPPPPSPL